MNLTRDSIGRLVRVDIPMLVQIPDREFQEGDNFILFNNTDEFLTLVSDVPNSYRSSLKSKRTTFEWPPHGLLKVLFVADDTMVVTIGL